MRPSIALWIPVARASGVRPAALHVTDDTARHLRYTSRAKREADVSLSHRCTMEHPVAPWSTAMRRVFHPETNGVKASPHRHKSMLSHGASADPSDPWNSHAAPLSPRQNGQRNECLILETILEEVHKRRIHAVELVLVPPLGLLVLGCVGFWV